MDTQKLTKVLDGIVERIGNAKDEVEADVWAEVCLRLSQAYATITDANSRASSA